MRGLHVKDDTTLGRTIERMLLLEGYGCHWATTGEEAVKFGQANEFDVILLDFGPPDRDGYEVATRRRDQGRQGRRMLDEALHVEDDRRRRMALQDVLAIWE